MDVLNQEDQKPVSFIKEGVKIGVINGAIALLIMYGSYFAGLDTFVNFQFYSRFIPYMMIILIIFGLQLRTKNGGYLSFKDALQYSFMSYVIAALLVAIGTYILFNLVDPNLTQKSFDLSLQRLNKMGMKQEDIEKMIGKREGQKTDFGTIFLGTGFGLIWDFIASLIVSVIIRREKPVF
jgi:hypothetical protein